MKTNRNALCLLAGVTCGLLGGCPDVFVDLSDLSDLPDTEITVGDNLVVEVFNDTDFEVAPRVYFNDENGFWEQVLSGSEELATGILEPGELGRYNMKCDRVAVIYSDEAGQFDGDFTIGQADTTRTLERGEDFDCGDTIRFQFIGHDDGFGVIVLVNDQVVD